MLDVLRRETNGPLLNPTGKVSSERQWMARATERSARSEAAKQYRRETWNKKKPRKKEEEGSDLRSVMIAATLAAPIGWGRCPLDPPWHPLAQQLWATTICLAAFFFFETPESPASQATTSNRQLLQSRPVAGSHPMEARVEQCSEGMGRLLSDSRARAESSAGLRRARPASRTKGNAAFEVMEAATQAREQQEEARLAYDQK